MFDIDKCTFEVTPRANDDYIEIFENADIKYNILDAGPLAPVTVIAFKTGFINETYTNNRWLAKIGSDSVLEYLAEQILAGVTVSSDFFNHATNTATLNPNLLLHLTIAQKSDIKVPDASDPATTAMMSWNELMEILWGMFQVRWDYDPDTDTINIEHISWWAAGAGLDLRSQLMTVATNKYTYLKEKMPKYEKYSFMEADDASFVGYPIWYNSGCVDQNTESNIFDTIISNVTTDLEYIISNNDAISDDGFVILCNVLFDGDYYVKLDYNATLSLARLNLHLSWYGLHHRYFRHNRVLITGYLNGGVVTFWTAKKTKHQECSAIICADYDPGDTITTELGETYLDGAKAQVQRSELSPSGEIKFNLLYGPDDNENTGVAEVKVLAIFEEKTGATESTYYGITNQETDVEVTCTFKITCEDAATNQCDTANFDLVIPINDYYGQVVIAWCTPVGAPVCVAEHTMVSITAGWTALEPELSDDSKC